MPEIDEYLPLRYTKRIISLDTEDCDKRSAKQDGVSGLALSRVGCRNWSALAGRVLPAPTLPLISFGDDT